MMKIQWEKLQIKKEETTMDNGINDHYLYISNVIKGLIIFKLRINTPNEIFKEYLRKPSYNRELMFTIKKKLCTKGHLYSITKGHLPVVKLVGIMYIQNMC